MKTQIETTMETVQKTRLEPWQIFQKIKDSQIKSGQYATHPESHALRKFDWEGMITIRFESGEYSEDNNAGESRRESLVRLFLNSLRAKWGLRRDDIYWVATTEYGKSGVAHCHILFNFYQLHKKGKTIPKLHDLGNESEESLKYICDLLDMPKSSADVDWQPKFDNVGLVAYFAKKEEGRDYKHFIWSLTPDKIAQFVFEEIEELEGASNE
jgi:hypothetical protein